MTKDSAAVDGNELSEPDTQAGGSGAYSILGYEYQIDVSVWLALDLVLANKLAQEIVLEPATEEDLEADLAEHEPSRVTSAVSLGNYRLMRTHQGKMCCGRTPMQTLIDGKEAWHDKITTLNN